MLLARRRDGGPLGVADAERNAVHAGELSMEELCRRHDLVLDLVGDPLRRPLGDAGRRGPAALRHPLLPRRRAARPGGRPRRRRAGPQHVGPPGRRPRPGRGRRAADDAADDRQPAPRRRVRRRPTRRWPSPTPSARRRASSRSSRRDDDRQASSASPCPATPTTTTLGLSAPAFAEGDLDGGQQAGRAAGHVRARRTGAAAGTTSSSRSAIARNARPRRRPPSSRATGRPASPPADTAGSSGTWPSSGTPISSASACAAAGAEQRVRRAVLAREVGHVLDHADDPHEAAPGHVGGPLGDLLGGQRRRRDDHHVGARQQPGEAHLDVAGARRHVDQQVVELAPVRRRAGTARRPWSASAPATSAPCPPRRGSRSTRPSAGRRRRPARWG